jgi:hypothetical protein
LQLKAKFSFLYETEREAKTVIDAISPDNIKAPFGLTVKAVRTNSVLSTLVRCEKSLETFIATLDDLLACISIAEKSFETVKDSGP